MTPIISIIGRPNVGKSTLYNRLTRSRDALVDDLPGVTRDRMVGRGRLGVEPYWIIDTGGLHSEEDVLQLLLTSQAQTAVSDSDAVIFLVDGRQGSNADDLKIMDYLRRAEANVFVAVNKAEGLDRELVTAEFHEFGATRTPVAISAKNGDGVAALIKQILEQTKGTGEIQEIGPDVPHIGILGRPNVGKSTLVNRLLGEERVVVCDLPGTTRDSIYVPFKYGDEDYVLVDTAGIRRKSKVSERIERYSIVKSLRTVDSVQVVILVLDAHQGIAEQDAKLAGLARQHGRSMVLVLNKWDGLSNHQRSLSRRDMARHFPFLEDVTVLYISAKFGSGMGGLMPAVRAAYASAMADLSTSKLNSVLRRAIEEQPPPKIGRREVKLKYAHQGGKNPPTVVIHGNMVHKVPESYKRYLANSIRKEFKLTGTRVNLAFRASENPYVTRRGAR